MSSCTVYTDGSSIGQGTASASAGIGVFYGQGDRRNISKRLPGTDQDNNRAEIAAVVAALSQAKVDRPSILNVYSDSNSAISTLKTCQQTPNSLSSSTKNADLFREAIGHWNQLTQNGVQVNFHVLPSHSRHDGNDGAHRLATEGAKLR